MKTSRNISLFVFLVAVLWFSTSCAKFQKKKTAIDPANVIIIDESRIDNVRVRHIFEEFLVQKMIRKGQNRIAVFVADTLNPYGELPELMDYKVSFDIMDYGITDVMKQTDKILASVKIVKYQGNGAVLSSFIESSTGHDLEEMCRCVAEALSRAVVKKLITLHTYDYELLSVFSDEEDSCQVQE